MFDNPSNSNGVVSPFGGIREVDMVDDAFSDIKNAKPRCSLTPYRLLSFDFSTDLCMCISEIALGHVLCRGFFLDLIDLA